MMFCNSQNLNCKFNVSPKICFRLIPEFSLCDKKNRKMKPAKKTESTKEQEKQFETTFEKLIEKKKLENEAYKKILKSLNTNKNK
jgi:rubrerythrin